MAYRIEMTHSASKGLDALPDDVLRKLNARIRTLAENPRPHNAKRLRGVEGFRIRFWDYRVVYMVEDERQAVVIVRVGPRGSVYEGL